jgi:CRISPR-associated exonuclease Cas4
MSDQADYLPISMLNQLEYCQRRFYLMHVLGEMEINAHILEGALRHAEAHTPGSEREGDLVTHRRVYLWSDDLGIAGFADLVEEKDGRTAPVEYKKGRMGSWLNDHVQLCAQALCLEERGGEPVDTGAIFYFGSRRRERVAITPELRGLTRLAIAQAHALVGAGNLPPPLENYAKCRDCSLEPTCLPREVKILAESR